jgi:hypothetical protein
MSDPITRDRTRRILIDLSDPDQYVIRIMRERVTEQDGELTVRRPIRLLVQNVTFDANGNPVGSPAVTPLIPQIEAAIATLDAEAGPIDIDTDE